jgi:hypothetical protein
LRVAHGESAVGQALLRRALLLTGPGELQELQEPHELQESLYRFGTSNFVFIASMLKQESAGARSQRVGSTPWDASRDALDVSSALASLRVIKSEHRLGPPVALIEHCAASLTELDCANMNGLGGVLPRCTRLESLSLRDLPSFPPATYLGLSQLHTLRGVSLVFVPAAAIAAALPRLHTLHLNHKDDIYDDADNIIDKFPVAAFFGELLPRLRSFHLNGLWPDASDETEAADVLPLPLLEDLKWRCPQVNLPPQFMGARPLTLEVSDVDIDNWLQAADGASPDSALATPPLARARALTLVLRETSPEAAFMARLLCAAPQLRRLTFEVPVDGDSCWILSRELSRNIVHDRLRQVALTTNGYCPSPPLTGHRYSGVELQRNHFRCLRRLTVLGTEFPV